MFPKNSTVIDQRLASENIDFQNSVDIFKGYRNIVVAQNDCILPKKVDEP